MQTLLLVKALVELHYTVSVWCYFEYDEGVVDEFQKTGVTVQLLGWKRSLGTIRFIRSLAALFQQQSPAVVHIQYMTPGLLPIIAARLARVPVVLATVHQPGTPYGIKPRLLLSLGAWFTDRFICVSEAAERSWFGSSCLIDLAHPERMNERRHFTIPNAVHISDIDKALATKSPIAIETAARLKGKQVVGTVARLSREKGIDILMRAFAEVHKIIPDVHLMVVGDGSQLMNLQELARHLGVYDAVTWMGRLSWNEAMGCLGLMDIVVVPSRYEGFGLTAVEAMTCAKPIVASRVDGLAEVIQDGVTGCLIPAGDVSALAAALTDLLKNEQKRFAISMAGRKYVEAYFTYPLFRQRCEILYKSFGVTS